jgi:hypothetical protein
MGRFGRASLVGIAVVALGTASSFAGGDGDRRGGRPRACSAATLEGAYGIQMQGMRPSGPPPAPFESMVGVVLRVYDGQGGFTQLDNVKGSVTGIAPAPRPGVGTYEVNADCTGVTTFQPAPGVTIEERFVIVNQGQEVLSMVSSPPPVMMTTIQKKIGRP